MTCVLPGKGTETERVEQRPLESGGQTGQGGGVVSLHDTPLHGDVRILSPPSPPPLLQPDVPETEIPIVGENTGRAETETHGPPSFREKKTPQSQRHEFLHRDETPVFMDQNDWLVGFVSEDKVPEARGGLSRLRI